MTRHQLHELLDEIPESEVNRLGDFIQNFLEEETLSQSDIRAIHIANEEIARGDTLNHSDVLSYFGIESKNF